jgi:hypothetical protein
MKHTDDTDSKDFRRLSAFIFYIVRGMVLLYDMGAHTGAPLRGDIIDNGNHGNVGANLRVRPACLPLRVRPT